MTMAANEAHLILIVEDNDDDYFATLRAFQKANFANPVRRCVTGDQALDYLMQRGEFAAPDGAPRPSLILLDYNLPDMDGLSFIKHLAGLSDRPIPIIMLTGEDNAEVAVEMMKRDADDYLIKDTAGQYLRLLPGAAGRVLKTHAQREQIRHRQQETEILLRRNQLLLQTSTDGIHILDLQGKVIEANDAFCRMLGYTQEEITQLSVMDFDALHSEDELRERCADLVGKSFLIETIHRRKNGELINEGRGANLRTTRTFDDFKLRV
ncbi:MAG: response regulator, partial [Gallionellaceae bacterium]|nr:response regulator [Gallionellaceae bacterium]